MTNKRNNKRVFDLDEDYIEVPKNKHSDKRIAARHASHYNQDNQDIPQRDDDYHFMVHNVLS